MLPVSASLTNAPAGGTSSGVKPWPARTASAFASSLMRVRTFSCPMPRRGSALVISTSSRTVRSPSPVTLAGTRSATAASRAADHEAAVVAAGDVRLHDHVAAAALAQRLGPRGADGGLVPQVQRDAPAVVAVERLDDARVAQAAGRGDGLVLGLHHLRARHREARRIEEAVGQLLVRRDVHRDAARPAGHRGADPLLVDALAELDEASSGRGACTGCRGRRPRR